MSFNQGEIYGLPVSSLNINFDINISLLPAIKVASEIILSLFDFILSKLPRVGVTKLAVLKVVPPVCHLPLSYHYVIFKDCDGFS